MSCPKCPHCIASGAYGLIDPKDPALTTNQTKNKKRAIANPCLDPELHEVRPCDCPANDGQEKP